MNETDLDAIRQRLGRLERQNRLLKRIGGVALICLALVVFAGVPAPPVKGPSFEGVGIRNKSGNRVAGFYSDKGKTRLEMFDPNQQLKVVAGIGSDKSESDWAFLELRSKDRLLWGVYTDAKDVYQLGLEPGTPDDKLRKILENLE